MGWLVTIAYLVGCLSALAALVYAGLMFYDAVRGFRPSAIKDGVNLIVYTALAILAFMHHPKQPTPTHIREEQP